MPKRTKKERDPVLWAQAQEWFDSANAGCYSPAHTEEAKVDQYYQKLLRAREKPLVEANARK